MTGTKLNLGISDKSFKIILDTLEKFSEIEKAVIFGSRAIGNDKPSSDIDIAIFGENITDDILRKINVLLNEKENIPYFVDIIDFNSIENNQLKEHILKKGKVLFSNSKLLKQNDK